jgi:hypothetical protein
LTAERRESLRAKCAPLKEAFEQLNHTIFLHAYRRSEVSRGKA